MTSRHPERVLIAVGGNAMTDERGGASPQAQIAAIERTMERVGDVVAAGHSIVLTHGNGPQVGNVLVKNEIAASVVPPVPLDWCGAQTQGTIGFIILDALDRVLRGRGIQRGVAALVSRTLVAAEDEGFSHPTKPIGRYLPAAEARVLIEHGQTWEDRGAKGWRRVVASPEPLEILDAPAARALMDAGFIVVASGGGGIPVERDDTGRLVGVEAVIDKDLAAAVLARAVRARILVIATDVEHAAVAYGTPHERPIGHTTADELRALAAEGQFASGSMGPKVEAAIRFVEAGGRRAVITSLDRIADAVGGLAGTVVEQSAQRVLVPAGAERAGESHA
jgi:carbamate kinase